MILRRYSGWLALLCVCLSGCSTYHGVKAVDLSDEDEESLQPTLRWEAVAEAGVTYDLVLYEALEMDHLKVPGRFVLYEKGISKPEFKVPIALKRDTRYFWSVRVRRDDQVSGWSVKDSTTPTGMGTKRKWGEFFRFKTPD